MSIVTRVVTVLVLLAGGPYGHTRAQDSRLRPMLDVVVAPVPTKRAKPFSIDAGRTNDLSKTLNGQPGESWGSAALVYDYSKDPRLGSNCTGFVSDAPNMRFHYIAAGLPDIRVLALADIAPFTLVVRGPNGHFYCSQATGLLINAAMIMFIGPPAGQYDIWEGFGRGDVRKATISLVTMAKNEPNGRN
jgi:hypothetical protein